ncbi:hypothetical protein ACLB2K_017919 [Fragaria x ananassa]
MIVDGVVISIFLKAWAAATAQSQSGTDQCIHVLPSFDGAALFPPILDEQGKFAHPTEATMRGLYRRFAKKGRCVNKRFVFEASAVAKLKELAATSSLQNPSRVVAVSAFIWKCARAAWKAKSGRSAPSLITHAVNLHRRADPNLPQNCMGNHVCLAGAIADDHHGEQELELSSLVSKMREATSKFNGDLVAKLQVSTTNGDDKVEMNYIGYTSIVYSGVYDADFGWGKPLWVVPVHNAGRETISVNEVRLMDTGEWGNNAIEAWINLHEEEMELFQSNQELLNFASLKSRDDIGSQVQPENNECRNNLYTRFWHASAYKGFGGIVKLVKLSKETGSTFSGASSDGGLDYICFSSWCNFGLYDTDFG